jgi:hypothetical protein
MITSMLILKRLKKSSNLSIKMWMHEFLKMAVEILISKQMAEVAVENF